MFSRSSQLGVCLSVLLLAALPASGAERHAATGLLTRIDRAHNQLVISCREIPGYMEAMEMAFYIRDAKQFKDLHPGTTVDFDVVEENGEPYAENLRLHPFESTELDPTAARRLKGVERVLAQPGAPKPIQIGEAVPNFTLVNEHDQPVSLSQYDGKVVAITFMYTRCPFPNYCARLSNNFSRLQKRFHRELGSDLVLLNVVIDTGHDQPETLATYAERWKADPKGWHFLTGSMVQVQTVCRYFDMNHYPDEGLYIHSFHTAVLDRNKHLVANLEGNEFTAKQLGDLVDTVLHPSNSK